MWGNPTQSWSIRFWIPRRRFRIPGTNLRAGSPGRFGGWAGKGRRACKYVSRSWIPPPMPLWLPVNWAVQFPPISAKRKRSANVKKKKRVMMSLLTSSPQTSISHRQFRCRSIFKFRRRSSKLSFLFPPRRQNAPESLLAGYPGTGFLSSSIDCCWMRIFFSSKYGGRSGTYTPTPSQAPTTGLVRHKDAWEESSPRFLDNQN